MTKLCGDAAWHEPQPQSKPWCAAPGATTADACGAEPEVLALVDPPISDAHDIPVLWPMSESSNGS